MGLSAFTDGLMGGLKTSQGIKNDKTYADTYKKYADLSERRFNREESELDNAPKIEDILSGLANIALGDTDAMPAQTGATDSVAFKPASERPDYGMGAIKGYASGGLVNLNGGVFSGGVPPSSAGLGAVAPPQPQQAPAQQEQLPPAQRLTKALMTSDVLSNPEKLSKMAAFAEMHGMGKAITPWLERAYSANKSGMVNGAMMLMQGRVDDAMKSLAQGGVKLADRPTPADPNNPRMWKINIEGTGEKVVDLGHLLQTTLDPKEFLAHDLKRNESQSKVKVDDSQIAENNARVKVSNAQVGKLGEETKSIREERKNSGGLQLTKLPAPVAISEWLVQKGIYKNHADAYQAVKTLNDKSPAAQRNDLIEARMKGGMASLSEAAKEVDDFLGTQGGANPTPTGGVRKWNPTKGIFEQ